MALGVPVWSWDGIIRIFQKILALSVVSFLINLLLKALTTPLCLAGIVACVNFAPNTIKWIWAKMGALLIDFALKMVDVFTPIISDSITKGEGGTLFNELSNVYNVAYTNLPTPINETLAFVGVHELLGLIISYYVLLFVLKTIFYVQDRVMTPVITGNSIGL